jgi:acyl-CoA reductase-like NAD-dependent aldehyde dehydrogenase
MAEPVNA